MKTNQTNDITLNEEDIIKIYFILKESNFELPSVQEIKNNDSFTSNKLYIKLINDKYNLIRESNLSNKIKEFKSSDDYKNIIISLIKKECLEKSNEYEKAKCIDNVFEDHLADYVDRSED